MTPDEAIGTLTGVGQAGEDAAAEPSGEWLGQIYIQGFTLA